MPKTMTISFAPLALPASGSAVVFVGADGKPSAEIATLLGDEALKAIARAATIERFKGKSGTALIIVSPAGLKIDKLVVVGTVAEGEAFNAMTLGGFVASKVGPGATSALFLVPGFEATPRNAVDFAIGAKLSAYKFDRYKTKKDSEEDGADDVALAICSGTHSEAAKLHAASSVAAGVYLARDLVNEPANVLFPAEFAKRCESLRELGVEVEVLDKAALDKIGMRTLLAVNEGSRREPRVVVMRWNGGKADAAPIAFVGKGVCFDTGGISIKPAAGMEDMKGDMAGAAAVTGLMQALAGRKAKVNVVGAIGLVENMPDGAAVRPGDIVTSLSGQTVEIINTDAEGRLVLADVLWHVKESFKPQFMVDLATLTGAIIVAIGQEHAGLYCNNEELAARLIAAGEATGETCWRMPLGKGYDKMLDSKFADMKNVGGRQGGASSAAMFIKRFVGDVPWAHLDIAGTAMGSKETEINHSWGSGWGVRLLDRLVSDHYET